MAKGMLAEALGSHGAPVEDEDGLDEDVSEDEDKKAAFLEMCQAIKSGDFETAWEAWQGYC